MCGTKPELNDNEIERGPTFSPGCLLTGGQVTVLMMLLNIRWTLSLTLQLQIPALDLLQDERDASALLLT